MSAKSRRTSVRCKNIKNEHAGMDARVRDFLLLIRSGGGRSVVPEKNSGQIQGKIRGFYSKLFKENGEKRRFF